MDGLTATIATPAESPLAAPEELPLLPPTTVATFGPTLVVAPHPDDESLGCGGAIALLVRAGLPVHVLFVSDGTGSHRDSPTYPPERLRVLREAEGRAALARLGLSGDVATFLRLPDRFVPWEEQPGFDAAVASVVALLRLRRPATILVPWRGEHHCDHVASWQIVRAAVEHVTPPPRLLEYPIWLWERAMPHRDPTEREVIGWRLDIGPVLAQKLDAIQAHQSQLTDLIADAQFAFQLEPDFLANFARPWEVYLEERKLQVGKLQVASCLNLEPGTCQPATIQGASCPRPTLARTLRRRRSTSTGCMPRTPIRGASRRASMSGGSMPRRWRRCPGRATRMRWRSGARSAC